MKKPSATAAGAGDSPKPLSPPGRFSHVLQSCFAGNQSAMAAAIECSPSIISRVVSGKTRPGSRLLLALSRCRGVNPQWAMTGEGEPMLPPDAGAGADNFIRRLQALPPNFFTEFMSPIPYVRMNDVPSGQNDRLVTDKFLGPAGNLMLPVANRLLPGPVNEWREYLSGVYRPVCHDDYQPSRYWIVSTAIHDKSLGLDVGDIALIESHPFWLQRPGQILNDLCVVVEKDSADPQFRQVTYDEKSRLLISASSIQRQPAGRQKDRSASRPGHGSRGRASQEASGESAGMLPAAGVNPERGLDLTAIVGIVILRERRRPWPCPS